MPSRISIFICIFTVFVCLTKVLKASEESFSYHPSWNYCSEADGEYGYPSRQVFHEVNRRSGSLVFSIGPFVEAWKKHFQVLHRKVPHLSPKENEYIISELRSGNYERYKRVRETLEYNIFTVVDWVHVNLDLLNKIEKAQTEKEKQFLLVHFNYRLGTVPEEEIYHLKDKKLIHNMTSFDDKTGELKSYDKGYIPNYAYDFQNRNALKSEHYQVGKFISKCLLIK